MFKTAYLFCLSIILFTAACSDSSEKSLPENQVRTTSGIVEGTDGSRSGIRVFKGIPYAAPPVGGLRWKAPQPADPWEGVFKADHFGNRCIQFNPFPDMNFQSEAEKEDCLSLSVWTPASAPDDRLPVMVWIHGGGFFSGAGDEKRHDGETLAEKGVVLVHLNYRLGLLGFLAHPELTAESEHKSSGNYGLLDQIAALQWVKENIRAFGGDPENVTIFGESAGALSVTALMASPLTNGLFQKAIGESGGFFLETNVPMLSLTAAEARGKELGKQLGRTSIAELRAVDPQDLSKIQTDQSPSFAPIVDGYVLPAKPSEIFASGRQQNVPLLAGWNSAEVGWLQPTTVVSFKKQLQQRFLSRYESALKFYPAGNEREANRSAVRLASDDFMGYGTWKWIEVHSATGNEPVYRYLFDQIRPTETGDPDPDVPGAAHATEIEYVFGTLDSLKLAWRDADRRVSDLMSTYWTNFAKTGDPSGQDLPQWPVYNRSKERPVMRIKAEPIAESDTDRERYEFLDSIIDPTQERL